MLKKYLLISFSCFLISQSYSCETVLTSEGDPFPSNIEVVHSPLAEDTTDAVVIAIFRNGEWLFGQRGDDSSSSNSWGLIGGKIDPGETPIQAARREVIEELGIEIQKFDWIMTRLTIDEDAPKNKFFRVFILRADYDSDLSSQEPEKVKSLKWMPFGEFPSPLFPPSEEYILDLIFELHKNSLTNLK